MPLMPEFPHAKMSLQKVPMTGLQPPEFMHSECSEYIRKEVTLMTAYEIISIFIEVLTVLISFGGLVIALLAFLDKRKHCK